jgi:hypothetical protein
LEPQYPHQYPDTITIISGSNNTNNTVVQFGGTNVSNTNESANITEENTLIHEENEEGSSAEATNPRRKEVEATRTTTENSIGGTTGRTPGNGPTSERSWSLSSTTEAPEVDVDVKLEEDMASTTEGPFPFSFRFRGTTASGPSPQPRTATEPSTMTSERPPGKHSGEEEIEKSEDGESADGKPIKKITKIREHYSEDGSTKKEEISSNSTEWTSDKTGKPSESSSDNNDNDNNETEEEKEAEKKLPIRPPEFRHNDVDHSAEYHRRNDTTRYVEKETNHNATDAEEKDVQPKVFVRLD